MTELTDNSTEIDLIGPRIPKQGRHIIDPVAFVLAFIAAPLIPALFFFWLLIPLAALIFGGPLWVLIGLPVLLWQLPRIGPDGGKIALMAIVANLLFTAGFALLSKANLTGADAGPMLVLYGGFGTVMAAIWGGLFAWAYRGFLPKPRRDLERAYAALRNPPFDPSNDSSFTYQA